MLSVDASQIQQITLKVEFGQVSVDFQYTADFTERSDLQALPVGMYTVTVANGSGSMTQKLIK